MPKSTSKTSPPAPPGIRVPLKNIADLLKFQRRLLRLAFVSGEGAVVDAIYKMFVMSSGLVKTMVACTLETRIARLEKEIRERNNVNQL